MKPENVFIDVQPWVLDIHKQLPNEEIPMSGIFRHAQTLSRFFQPAYVQMPGEPDMVQAHRLLSDFLRKPVQLIRPDLENGLEYSIRHSHDCQAWINLAPDCAGPAAQLNESYKVLTIVHDAQALVRDFGPNNRTNFLRSMENSDAFLLVSQTAYLQMRAAWEHYLIPKPSERFTFIRYGCSHSFETLPPMDSSKRSVLNFSERSNFSISVSGVYPHKNLGAIATLIDPLELHHLHIGRLLKPTEKEMLGCIDAGMFFIGSISDAATWSYMSAADLFICLSKDEGFSMPAMEACMMGCARFILSDIPAHQEVYGHLDGFTFVDPDLPWESLGEQMICDVMALREADERVRQELFESYHPENVLNGLRRYLELN